MVPNPTPTRDSGPALLVGAGWFNTNWMFVSGVLCPLLVCLLLLFFKGSLKKKFQNPLFVGWLTVPVYCLHQLEEHGYDARGWRHAFVPDFNYGVGNILFPICDDISHITCPLNVLTTTYVNVLLIWVSFSMTMVAAHALGGRYRLAGLFNWGTSTANGLVGHVMPAMLAQQYNPGCLQSLFIMVPMGIFVMSRCGLKFFALAMLCGALAHIVMFGIGINLVLRAGVPPPVEAVLIVISGTALPLAFASCAPVDSDRAKWYITVEDSDGYSMMEEPSARKA
mmetsp:Transcript_81317/g.230389  ORF Transcript_81317/g.230389 Transcript_81317/m.230389 type:complete len:281 (-) Transcript_81317:60-902(-)|eukprot:CAMPEP_0168437848 /NCGR_PEP_ID=MMETSP0228-20121227/41653_1 /TAXON_ID=133427 /ORGANISM="Protoceratium reticulatum, Strain CCCM 535 (=CCMP 1889)" /LENGTH=280 /DNA_ID=CAMNT_0008452089 /DNA_START=63 /DNA_END=905 /DNA_ORIENTATION=+